MNCRHVMSIALLTSISVMIGCGSRGSNSAPTTQPALREVIDTSQCVGQPPQGVNLIGQYRSDWQGAQFNEIVRLSIQQNQITVSDDCKNSADIASVTVPSSFTATELTLSQKAFAKTTGAGSDTCSVGVHAGSLDYQLVGNCIKFSRNGKSWFMVREPDNGH